MLAAVIGIGSNSVRMLVASIEGGKGKRLLRDRAGTRLFAGLDAQGNLSAEAMATTVGAVAAMAARARGMGCTEVSLFATSAVRDAKNGAELEAMLEREAGVTMEVCSGEEEASLSFYGATDGEYCGVIDIGGGSTEVAIGQGPKLQCVFSCQMGAVRLFRMAPLNSAKDIPSIVALADRILCEKLDQQEDISLPNKWIGIGGTFTTLAAMALSIAWTERTYMHGTVITHEQVFRLAETLADMPMEERLQLPGLQPNRADIVVHGICILLACMERIGIERITVSEFGNLDGYMKRRYALEGEIQR